MKMLLVPGWLRVVRPARTSRSSPNDEFRAMFPRGRPGFLRAASGAESGLSTWRCLEALTREALLGASDRTAAEA